MNPFNDVVVLGKVSTETQGTSSPVFSDAIEGSRTKM
jgi:hypothetical protein